MQVRTRLTAASIVIVSLLSAAQAGTYSIVSCSQTVIVSGSGWSTVQNAKVVDFGLEDYLVPMDYEDLSAFSTSDSRFTWTIRWKRNGSEPVPQGVQCRFATFMNRYGLCDVAGPSKAYHARSSLQTTLVNASPVINFDETRYGPGHNWWYTNDVLTNPGWNRIDYQIGAAASPWTYLGNDIYETTVVMQPLTMSVTEASAEYVYADVIGYTGMSCRMKLFEIDGQAVAQDDSSLN